MKITTEIINQIVTSPQLVSMPSELPPVRKDRTIFGQLWQSWRHPTVSYNCTTASAKELQQVATDPKSEIKGIDFRIRRRPDFWRRNDGVDLVAHVRTETRDGAEKKIDRAWKKVIAENEARAKQEKKAETIFDNLALNPDNPHRRFYPINIFKNRPTLN